MANRQQHMTIKQRTRGTIAHTQTAEVVKKNVIVQLRKCIFPWGDSCQQPPMTISAIFPCSTLVHIWEDDVLHRDGRSGIYWMHCRIMHQKGFWLDITNAYDSQIIVMTPPPRMQKKRNSITYNLSVVCTLWQEMHLIFFYKMSTTAICSSCLLFHIQRLLI